MTKVKITRLFVGSLIALGAGLVLMFAAGAFAIAKASFVMNGPQVVGIQSTPFAWSMLALAAIGAVVTVGGLLGQLVAWIGAVLITAELEDNTWFVLLLLLGLLSFGFVAMIVYLIAGPDGSETVADQRFLAARPSLTA
jgi:hypothetical protein